MNTFFVVLLLLQPPSLNMLISDIKKPQQEELLFSILGRLDYTDNHKFVAVNDPTVQQELKNLLATNKLDGVHGAACIYNKKNWTLAWGEPLMHLPLHTLFEPSDNLLQFKKLEKYRFAALNFWIKNDDGSKDYFQLIIALKYPYAGLSG